MSAISLKWSWQVFDSSYNGYSTDELFFVRPVMSMSIGAVPSHSTFTVQPRLGRPALGKSEQGPFRVVSRGQRLHATENDGSCPRYSPMNFVNKWSTPQLLIHGSKDYRLPETESIGAFHALQQFVDHRSLHLRH